MLLFLRPAEREFVPLLLPDWAFVVFELLRRLAARGIFPRLVGLVASACRGDRTSRVESLSRPRMAISSLPRVPLRAFGRLRMYTALQLPLDDTISSRSEALATTPAANLPVSADRLAVITPAP